jgi:hypothetical protein
MTNRVFHARFRPLTAMPTLACVTHTNGKIIDAQVKSWSNPRKSGGTWCFDGLNEAQFNKLAGPDYTVPRYLFLVLVPRDAEAYAEVLTDGMLLRYQSYYVSLREEDRIADPSTRRSRTVRVPVGNILTVRSLCTFMLPGGAR